MSLLGNTKHVAVLRGGPGEEYDQSIQTGLSVLDVLAKTKYQVDDIIVTQSGEWLRDGIVRQPKDTLAAIDVVFIALHGAYGENGAVQRLLERFGVPYTGSGPYASSIALNKMLTKEHLKKIGVKMAPHMRVTHESKNSVARIVNTITNLFGPEYVVKPTNGGSSIGLETANSPATLIAAIERALSVYDDVLVEQLLRGREATCGVVENFRNQGLYRLPTVEIALPPGTNLYSADVKTTGSAHEICPGRFKTEEKKQLEDLARVVHSTLGLRQYSRSDFMVTDNDIYFLEVNTRPYLGVRSPFTTALESVGSSYDEFIIKLVESV